MVISIQLLLLCQLSPQATAVHLAVEGWGGGSIQTPAFIAPAVIGFSAVINNGATETNSANVNLTLSGGAAAHSYLQLF